MLKKIGIFLCLTLVLTGCSNKKIKTYTEITYEEFKQKMENKETFPLFVGSKDCSHCDDYKITINKLVSEYQFNVYYIDIANMTKEENAAFKTIINYSGTPTTVFITDGKEKTTYNRIDGALPYSKVVSKFKKLGYGG